MNRYVCPDCDAVFYGASYPKFHVCKPELCPFCGNKPDVKGRQVFCETLNCRLWGHVFSLAQWNNRPIEKKLKAENKELKAEIRILEKGYINR